MKTIRPISLLLAGFFAGRLIWILATGFVEEDAFITYRYAEQLAGGNGFTYNLGERVYGTSTPLFTLLLAGWSLLMPGNPALGARVIGLGAASLGILFLDRGLIRFGARRAQRALVAGAFILSPKLITFDTAGMETPLVLGLLSAAWYVHVRQLPTAQGMVAGLLVWTRPDLLLWPVALVLAGGLDRSKTTFRIGLTASAVYLPWFLFSWLYFGTPVPNTITAKYVAYLEHGYQFADGYLAPPLAMLLQRLEPLGVALGGISPLDGSGDPGSGVGGLAIPILLIVLWESVQAWPRIEFRVLPVFAGLFTLYLTIGRVTFFPRYFAPAVWAVCVLLGLGLGDLWQRVHRYGRWRALLAISIAGLAACGIAFGLWAAQSARALQSIRHDQALTRIGLWLNQNTDPGARVLLEPLGYIGYHADRYMLDEVGLITPQIVRLKRQGITGTDRYIEIFSPDYVVLHCDDSLRLAETSSAGGRSALAGYRAVQSFNPLGFDPTLSSGLAEAEPLARNSCYEIWEIRP